MSLTFVIAWQVVQVMPAWLGGIGNVVVVGIIEFAREEGHRIMATGAPAGCLGRAVEPRMKHGGFHAH